MNDNSWLKIYRKLEDWHWFQDSKTVHVFIFLLLRANIKNTRWNGRLVRRGQLVTSYQKIAYATGMSVSSAKRALNNLVSTGEIIAEPTNRYNLITVVKYENYQAQYADTHDFEHSSEQATEQSSEHPSEHSTEHHHKREKNIEKNKSKFADAKHITHTDSKPRRDTKSKKTYVPQYFELDLKLPKQYYGKFKNEDEWWNYVEQHRDEVEMAYEL